MGSHIREYLNLKWLRYAWRNTVRYPEETHGILYVNREGSRRKISVTSITDYGKRNMKLNGSLKQLWNSLRLDLCTGSENLDMPRKLLFHKHVCRFPALCVWPSWSIQLSLASWFDGLISMCCCLCCAKILALMFVLKSFFCCLYWNLCADTVLFKSVGPASWQNVQYLRWLLCKGLCWGLCTDFCVDIYALMIVHDYSSRNSAHAKSIMGPSVVLGAQWVRWQGPRPCDVLLGPACCI